MGYHSDLDLALDEAAATLVVYVNMVPIAWRLLV
jgi:hypothetical protein